MDNNFFIRELHIDLEFKTLLAPLSQKEFEQLEENIKTEGCLEPLTIWNGVIIDGHNRYNICHKHNIPFRTRNIYFKNREEAIIWICTNQLGRRNLSEETKKYLIGKKYETEKNFPNHNRTAHEMGMEYNISHHTVYKYGIYSKAMDIIQKKCPEITRKILAGNIKASHDNTINLSKLSKEELYNLLDYLTKGTESQISYSDIRHEPQWKPLQKNSKKSVPILQQDIPIKQLPKYDPDAEISSLSLTIPSWISSINRTKNNTKFDSTTAHARSRLSVQLENLKSTIEDLLVLTKEKLQ